MESSSAAQSGDWEDGDQLSWPLIWLVGSHHYRHRWCSSSQANGKEITQRLWNWATRVRWQAALADSLHNPYYVIETKKENPTPFIGRGRPIEGELELQRLLDLTSQAVQNTVQESVFKHVRIHKPGIVQFALKLISKCDWCFTKTDKDGGFATSWTST